MAAVAEEGHGGDRGESSSGGETDAGKERGEAGELGNGSGSSYDHNITTHVTRFPLTVKHLTSLSRGMPETESTVVRMKSSSNACLVAKSSSPPV